MKLNLLKNALLETKSKKKELLSQVKTDSVYVTNKEIERVRVEEQRKKLEEKESRKRKHPEDYQEDESKIKRQKSIEEDTSLSIVMPDRIQVMKLLRQYKEPITVFGESDMERWTRLKLVEKKHSELVNEQQNQFQKNLKEEEVARQERESLARSTGSSTDTNTPSIDISKPLPTAEEFGQQADEYVRFMLQRLLEEWRVFLKQRPLHEQNSASGKREYGNWKQTTQYLDPLFHRLDTKTLDPSQLKFFSKIFTFIAQKEYVQANDQYLQLAIGNVAWPMGVENIGIHARSSREKISSVNVAHVLNDDTQRKYIQSVKRLMTFAQKKYPTIPSKMVS